jgi:hypothetical protein
MSRYGFIASIWLCTVLEIGLARGFVCTTANLICFARDLYVTHALLPFKEGYTLPLIAVYVPLGVIVACGKFISINIASDHLVNHIVFL